MSIKLPMNFKLEGQMPLDNRLQVNVYANINTEIPSSARYPGMIVYAKDTNTLYTLDGDLSTWNPINKVDSSTTESQINTLIVDILEQHTCCDTTAELEELKALMGITTTNTTKFVGEFKCTGYITDFSTLDFGGPEPLISFKKDGSFVNYRIIVDSPTKIYLGGSPTDNNYVAGMVDNAVSITMNIPSTVTDCSNMLHTKMNSVKSLQSLTFTDVDTSHVTTMEGMFNGCQGLTSLDVSKFDTSSCTTMKNMFYSCEKLTELDCRSFDTSRVTDMSGMFDSCSACANLNVTSFDTRNVHYMGGMFSNNGGWTSLDLSSFDTSNVEDIAQMFWWNSRLTSLDIRNFDLNSLAADCDLSDLFNYCNALTLANINMANCDSSTKNRITTAFNGRQTS